MLRSWFESGAMPYASIHYPFEHSESFRLPADFIAEGLDQTRGWFYTLMVLSTALFDKPAFKNLIVNGLVLAEDGKKMSKRLKNYPDPMKVVNAYGADALRLYLIDSPVVHSDPLRFKVRASIVSLSSRLLISCPPPACMFSSCCASCWCACLLTWERMLLADSS